MMLTLLLLCWVVSLERRCNTIRGRKRRSGNAAGVELSGAVYRLSDGAGVKQELWGLVIVAVGFTLLARRWCSVWTGRCC